MKRGGHVAGRRGSHCLCDSVQIHPTLKRRMCTKRKRGESCGCTKLSSTAKNPPAAGHTPRHERMKHRGRISTRVCSFTKKKKKSHSSLSLHYSSDSPVRSPFLRCEEKRLPLWPRRGSGSPTQTREPPIFCGYPPTNETVPPTKPARC